MTEKMMNKVMLECIRIARQNMDDDQYPIGAIITDDRGKIISSSRSSLRKELDPTNHPEIAAIRKASKILKRRNILHLPVSTIKGLFLSLATSK